MFSSILLDDTIITQKHSLFFSSFLFFSHLSKYDENEGDIARVDENSEYGIENYTENQYNSDELYTSTDDFVKKVLPNDRSSFARSLAYRTTGMKKGEVRTFVILGAASQAYCFKADGYMHGKMIKTFKADNKEILESILNEYDTIDQSAEDAALWAEAFQSNEGGIGSSGSIFERGQSDFANTLHADTPDRYGTRNNERSGHNYQYDRAEIDETIKKLKEIYGIDDDTHYSLSKEGDIAPTGRYTGLAIEEDIAPTATTEDTEGERIARVLTKEPAHVGKDKSYFNTFRTHWLDDASVFEDLALKTGNRELQAKFNYIKSADARAQYLIGNGAEDVPSLQSIKDKVDAEGMPQEFSEYMYHKHNIDKDEKRVKDLLARNGLQLSTPLKISNSTIDTADRINGLERPKPNEGYALKNGISNKSISPLSKTVKGNPQFSLSESTQRDIAPVGDYEYAPTFYSHMFTYRGKYLLLL